MYARITVLGAGLGLLFWALTDPDDRVKAGSARVLTVIEAQTVIGSCFMCLDGYCKGQCKTVEEIRDKDGNPIECTKNGSGCSGATPQPSGAGFSCASHSSDCPQCWGPPAGGTPPPDYPMTPGGSSKCVTALQGQAGSARCTTNDMPCGRSRPMTCEADSAGSFCYCYTTSGLGAPCAPIKQAYSNPSFPCTGC